MQNMRIAAHYDRLIDENNDPVHDPKPLKDHMDKWDGQRFLDAMLLDKGKTALEIGVGTGRLAVRVAPLVGKFTGIDLSPKTVLRAEENLRDQANVTLICGDFLTYPFGTPFDVIYSSLTFMHIHRKAEAIQKAAELLTPGGRLVLSIDKNQEKYIDTGTSRIEIFPDTREQIVGCMENAGLTLDRQFETEFAVLFVAKKQDK